jgi:hypothetical protein
LDDRSQQWSIDVPENISAVLPADGVTDEMPVNYDTESAVSPESDENYEEGRARRS